MKAIIYTKYGSPEVLQLKEIEKPIPKDDEILIKVYATTVTSAEGMMRRGDTLLSRLILGLLKPKKKYQIMGIEIAGEIESRGKNVKRFNTSDSVYGFTGFVPGAYAQYKCLPEKASLEIKPKNLTFVEAAASVDGATTALFFLRDKAHIKPGHKVLIIGASGSIGTFAVQLSLYFGAEVTGVCSTPNLELVKSIGASEVIDYTKEDFAQNGKTYDIIFDTVGKSAFSHCKASLKKKGRYLVTNGSILKNLILTFFTSFLSNRKFIYGMSVEKKELLGFLKKLIEEGKIKPVIDKIYSMEQIVEAHRYVEKGHKKGNVVITIEQNNSILSEN